MFQGIYNPSGRLFRLLFRLSVPVWLGLSAAAAGESPAPDTRSGRRVLSIERDENGYRKQFYATLRFEPGAGELVVWNRGADPELNPVLRVRFSLPPVPDSAGWCYEGVVFRNLNPGKPARIESGTKLENYRPGTDFLLREADRESRYRIGGRVR